MDCGISVRPTEIPAMRSPIPSCTVYFGNHCKIGNLLETVLYENTDFVLSFTLDENALNCSFAVFLGFSSISSMTIFETHLKRNFQ